MTIDFRQPTVLYGGSFDPPHDGHIAVIRALKRALPNHQIVVVPANISPGKAPPMAAAPLRLQWLEAIARREGFLVWDAEIQRGGESYTVETLTEAHAAGAVREKLIWAVGADAYSSLPKWKDPSRLRELALIGVFCRPGTQLALSDPMDILIPMAPHSASSTAIRAAIRANTPLESGIPKEVKSELERLSSLNQNPYQRKE